jgi:twinkle protein
MQDGETWTCQREDIHEKFFIRNGEELQCSYKEEDNATTNIEELGLLSKSYRDIEASTFRKFGIKFEADTSNGEMTHHYFPVTREGKIIGYHVRGLADKTFSNVGNTKGEKELFNQCNLSGGGKKLLITEGHYDCLSAYDMLKRKYPQFEPNVVSTNNGVGSGVSDVRNNLSFINSYDEVLLCFDNDKAGDKLTADVAKLLGSKAKVIKFSEKDCNDMLMEGKAKDFISAFWSAEMYRPPLIVTVLDVIEDALKEPERGRPWPWESLNQLTYGRRDGEGMYAGAGVKIGKSEFINEFAAHVIQTEDYPIALIKFEEIPAKTVKRIAGKLDGTFYHRPDIEYSKDKLRNTIMSFNDKLLMYKAFGPANWDSVSAYIRYAVSMGCKDIVIDPITKLTNHLDSSQTETELRKISDEIACMAQDLKFFYIITCHLKTPQSGPPHELGGRVTSAQFRGSRAMMENCFQLMGIERNKDPLLPPEQRNLSTFSLLEEREYGNVGTFPVYYDNEIGSYREPDPDKIDVSNINLGV